MRDVNMLFEQPVLCNDTGHKDNDDDDWDIKVAVIGPQCQAKGQDDDCQELQWDAKHESNHTEEQQYKEQGCNHAPCQCVGS